MSAREQITSEARRSRLVLFSPKIPATDAAAVRKDVVNLIMAVDYRGWNSDHAMLTALYAYASNTYRDYGLFDPAVHIGEAYIAAHETRHLSHLSDRTIATYNSSIRRALHSSRMHTKRGRPKAAAPYSSEEWDALVDAAETAGRWAFPATLILALSGSLAMRAEEIGAARSSWVGTEDKRVWIDVPNADGVLRRIPAFGEAAQIIKQAAEKAGPDDYLLQPEYGSRHNICSRIKENASYRSPDFDRFQIRRARNTCIANWMTECIPFIAIAFVADLVTPQTHFVSDLTCMMAKPDDYIIEIYLATQVGEIR